MMDCGSQMLSCLELLLHVLKWSPGILMMYALSDCIWSISGEDRENPRELDHSEWSGTFLSESHLPWRLAASGAVVSHGLVNIALVANMLQPLC